MKMEYLGKNLENLIFQRNIFLFLTILFSVVTLILSSFLFLKNEKIIVTPAIIEKEFWVDRNNVSATYLETFGIFLGKLALENSPKSAESQRNVLLRHVDPSFFGVVNQKLREEEKRLAKDGSSYVFYPVDVLTDIDRLQVILTGDRIFYIQGKPISTNRETYTLSFSNSGARLLLKGIEAKKDE